MTEDKSGFLINLFDKEFIYALEKENGIDVSKETSSTSLENEAVNDTKKELVAWGNNAKGIVIIIQDKTDTFIAAQHKLVLTKIFEALKLNLENDVLIINREANQTIDKSAIEELNSKILISFGVNLFELGYKDIAFDNYELKEVKGQLILPSESIDKMTANVNAKKAFWLAVQRATSGI